jgi:hypothetical protein
MASWCIELRGHQVYRTSSCSLEVMLLLTVMFSTQCVFRLIFVKTHLHCIWERQVPLFLCMPVGMLACRVSC